MKQKTISFYADTDIIEILNSQENKTKFINNAVKNFLNPDQSLNKNILDVEKNLSEKTEKNLKELENNFNKKINELEKKFNDIEIKNNEITKAIFNSFLQLGYGSKDQETIKAIESYAEKIIKIIENKN